MEPESDAELQPEEEVEYCMSCLLTQQVCKKHWHYTTRLCCSCARTLVRCRLQSKIGERAIDIWERRYFICSIKGEIYLWQAKRG